LNDITTKVNVESYFYSFDANGNIIDTRLDPIANNSWFNGQTLSEIVLNFYNSNRAESYTQTNYKENNGTIVRNFYGNSYELIYTEIEGYSLTMINYFGQNYYLSYSLVGGNYVVSVTDANGNAKTLPKSISISYSRSTGSVYGTYTFIIQADTNTFESNFIKLYSSPKAITVEFNSNKQSSSSPVVTNDSNLTSQILYFNQVTLLNANQYSIVGYTFMGYSTASTWTNASRWSKESRICF